MSQCDVEEKLYRASTVVEHGSQGTKDEACAHDGTLTAITVGESAFDRAWPRAPALYRNHHLVLCLTS